MTKEYTLEEIREKLNDIDKDRRDIRLNSLDEYQNLSWALTGLSRLQLDFKEANKNSPSLNLDIRQIGEAKQYIKRRIKEIEEKHA